MTRAIISCPECKVNRLAEITIIKYEVGVVFEQLTRCLTCHWTFHGKLDLTENKKEVHDDSNSHVLPD